MIRLSCALVTCVLCQAQWTPIPNPPSTRIFEIHDTSAAFGPGSIGVSSRSLVTGNPNGLWHTENRGASAWSKLSGQQVSSWLLNCSNEIVYTQLGAGFPITRLIGNVTPHNSDKTGDFRRIAMNNSTCAIYALEVNGSVSISTDGGSTFGPMSPQTHFAHANAIGALGVRPNDGAVFVCDEVESCEMFNGTTWQDVGVANNANAVFFLPDNSAWACDSNNYPRKWNGSSAWNTVSITSSFVFRCHGGAVNTSTGTYLTGRDYTDAKGPYVFRSTDGGATWTQFMNGLTVSAGGESEMISVSCDGTLLVATDEDSGNAGSGIYYYPGLGANTCGAARAIQITGSLGGGTVATAYQGALSASGGTPPYSSWTVVSGALPQGLSLNSTTGALTGTPTTAGTFNFTIQVTDSKGANASNAFSIVIANAPPAKISLNAIANGASYASGSVAPGEIVALFGSGLAGPSQQLQLDQRGYVASNLGGTQVLFDGVPAPLIYTTPVQVGAVVPYEVAGEVQTQIQIAYQGQMSNVLSMPVATLSPGMFTSDASGRGNGAILNQDGSANSPQNPAAPGSIITLFATGEGVTNPAGVDGKPAAIPLPSPQSTPVVATIGGLQAQVQYSGGAPGLVAGVWQLNLQVPAGVASGAMPIQISIGGQSSQTGVTLSVR